MAEVLDVKDSVWIGADRQVDYETVHPGVVEALEDVDWQYRRDPKKFYGKIFSFLDRSRSKFSPSSILISERGDSNDYCLVSQPPFSTSLLPTTANPNSFNIVIKNYLLNQAVRRREIVAPDGNFMSSLIVSAPDRDYWPFFGPLGFSKILSGDFSPYAKRILDVVKDNGFETGYFYGVSRAAVVGAAAIRIAPKNNVDVMGGVLIEPTDYQRGWPWRPALNFLREFKPGSKPEDLAGHWWNDGPKVMLALQSEYGDGSYLGNFVTSNVLASAIGFSGNRFLDDIRQAAGTEPHIPSAVGYGENSALGSKLPERLAADEELRMLAMNGLLTVLRARGPASSHGFTENHVAHAAIISDGLESISI